MAHAQDTTGPVSGSSTDALQNNLRAHGPRSSAAGGATGAETHAASSAFSQYHEEPQAKRIRLDSDQAHGSDTTELVEYGLEARKGGVSTHMHIIRCEEGMQDVQHEDQADKDCEDRTSPGSALSGSMREAMARADRIAAAIGGRARRAGRSSNEETRQGHRHPRPCGGQAVVSARVRERHGVNVHSGDYDVAAVANAREVATMAQSAKLVMLQEAVEKGA